MAPPLAGSGVKGERGLMHADAIAGVHSGVLRATRLAAARSGGKRERSAAATPNSPPPTRRRQALFASRATSPALPAGALCGGGALGVGASRLSLVRAAAAAGRAEWRDRRQRHRSGQWAAVGVGAHSPPRTRVCERRHRCAARACGGARGADGGAAGRCRVYAGRHLAGGGSELWRRMLTRAVWRRRDGPRTRARTSGTAAASACALASR